jgi:hypothetical protein
LLSIDTDRKACPKIISIIELFRATQNLAFANGGNQNKDTIPEKLICEELGITLLDGQGEKIQSSNWLLKK